MRDDLTTVQATLAEKNKRVGARPFLIQNQAWIAQQLAEWSGPTLREFWDTLAEHAAKQGVVGRSGGMSGHILHMAWKRMPQRHVVQTPTRAPSRGQPIQMREDDDRPGIQFPSISGKKL